MSLKIDFINNKPSLRIDGQINLSKNKILELFEYLKGSKASIDLVAILEQNLTDENLREIKYHILSQNILAQSTRNKSEYKRLMTPIIDKVVKVDPNDDDS